MRLSRVSSSILLRSFASAFGLALLTGCAAIQHEEILLEPTVPQKMISQNGKPLLPSNRFPVSMVGTGWFIRVKSGTHRQIRPNLESVSLSVKETISYRRPELTQKGASKLMGTCLASLFRFPMVVLNGGRKDIMPLSRSRTMKKKEASCCGISALQNRLSLTCNEPPKVTCSSSIPRPLRIPRGNNP